MADATWPATLPDCTQSWEETEDPDPILRTKMEAGPPKVRARFTAPIRVIRVGMTLRADQFVRMRDFFDIDCARGVNFHTFRHPYTGAVERFRFMAPPVLASASALSVDVAMQWEQLPYG